LAQFGNILEGRCTISSPSPNFRFDFSVLSPHLLLNSRDARGCSRALICLQVFGGCQMLKRFIAAACLCAATVAEADPGPLSGQEITGLVAGATVEIDTPLGTKLPIRYTVD